MDIEYRRDMNHNYMIVKGIGQEMPWDYETKVISTNRIPGLLTCRMQYIDSEVWYSYDVTSLQKLTVFCESRRIGKTELVSILAGVLGIMDGLEDFLLDFQHLVLLPSCICVDFDTMQIRLMYLPIYRQDIRQSLRELTEYLLGCADHSDQGAIVLGYRFCHEVQENNTQLGDLIGVLYTGNSATKKQLTDPMGTSSAGNAGTGLPEEEGRRLPPGLSSGDLQRGRQVSASPEESENPYDEDRPSGEGPSRRGRTDLPPGKDRIPFFKRPAVIAVAAGLCLLAVIYVLLHTRFLYYVSISTLCGVLAALCAVALAIYLIRERRRSRPDKRGKMSAEKNDREGGRTGIDGARGNPDNDVSDQTAKPLLSPDQPKPKTDRKTAGEGTEKICVCGQDREEMTTLLSAYRPESGPEDRWLLPASPECEPVHLTGEDLLIGKQRRHVDMIIDSPTVSRIHAKLIFRAGRYFIMDLSSRNGTGVNGDILCGEEERMLEEGDVIAFADAAYTFSRTKDGPRCENRDEGV